MTHDILGVHILSIAFKLELNSSKRVFDKKNTCLEHKKKKIMVYMYI